MTTVTINNYEQKQVEQRMLVNQLVDNGMGSLLRTVGSKIADKASSLKAAAGTFKKGAKVGYSSPGLTAGGSRAFRGGMRAGQAGAKAKAAGSAIKGHVGRHKRTYGLSAGLGAVGAAGGAALAMRRKRK